MRWHTSESNRSALASAIHTGQLTDGGQLVLSLYFASWNDKTNPATFVELFVNHFFNRVTACGTRNKPRTCR